MGTSADTIQLRDSKRHRPLTVFLLVLNASVGAIIVWRLIDPGDGGRGVLFSMVLLGALALVACFAAPAVRSLRFGPGHVALNGSSLAIHCRPVVDGELTLARSDIAEIDARNDSDWFFGAFGSARELKGGVVGVSLRKPNVLIRLSEPRSFDNVRRLTTLSKYPPHRAPLRRGKRYGSLWLCVDDSDAERLAGWFDRQNQ